jgi:hypothetical protein
MLLGYSDAELANLGGYDLVHYDDLAYVASAHQERKLLCTCKPVFVCQYKMYFQIVFTF